MIPLDPITSPRTTASRLHYLRAAAQEQRGGMVKCGLVSPPRCHPQRTPILLCVVAYEILVTETEVQ